ncbi:MAG: TIGR01906 family membrane protein [Defluviitaleaceae bacterium]|nr:TIGR01906 family membrane protein [Defluviitaleaceae bacterium]
MKKTPKIKKYIRLPKIAATFNTFSLIVLALFFGIQISAFHMWFYYWQFNTNNTYELVAMEREHLHEVTRHLIAYMRTELDRDTGLQIATYVDGVQRYFFSDLEIKHMWDVYDLFYYGFIIRNVLAAIFLTSLGYIIYKKEYRQMFKAYAVGSLATLTFLVVLVSIISINWTRAWHIFHYIFFNNDYWLLNPRVDLLINIVPYPFFFAMTSFIGGFFALVLLIMAISSLIFLKKVLFHKLK